MFGKILFVYDKFDHQKSAALTVRVWISALRSLVYCEGNNTIHDKIVRFFFSLSLPIAGF